MLGAVEMKKTLLIILIGILFIPGSFAISAGEWCSREGTCEAESATENLNCCWFEDSAAANFDLGVCMPDPDNDQYSSGCDAYLDRELSYTRSGRDCNENIGSVTNSFTGRLTPTAGGCQKPGGFGLGKAGDNCADKSKAGLCSDMIDNECPGDALYGTRDCQEKTCQESTAGSYCRCRTGGVTYNIGGSISCTELATESNPWNSILWQTKSLVQRSKRFYSLNRAANVGYKGMQS